MISQQVFEYIYSPLADIVEEYTNTIYHLLMFRNDFTVIADLGTVEAGSELEAVGKIIDNDDLFRALMQISLDRLNDWGRIRTVFTRHLDLGEFNYPLSNLYEYYESNPELLLSDIEETWQNKEDSAYALVPDNDKLYQIWRHNGNISDKYRVT